EINNIIKAEKIQTKSNGFVNFPFWHDNINCSDGEIIDIADDIKIQISSLILTPYSFMEIKINIL
ncbi:hypothetical protein J0M40_21795, partial [Providencia rettgeri]